MAAEEPAEGVGGPGRGRPLGAQALSWAGWGPLVGSAWPGDRQAAGLGGARGGRRLMFRSLPPLCPPVCQPPVSLTAGPLPPSPAWAPPGAHGQLTSALGPHAHPPHALVLGLSDPTQTFPGLVSGFPALGVLGSQGIAGHGPSSKLPPSACQ